LATLEGITDHWKLLERDGGQEGRRAYDFRRYRYYFETTLGQERALYQKYMYTKYAAQIIREGLATYGQLNLLPRSQIRRIMTQEGVVALRENLISFADLFAARRVGIPLRHVLTGSGLECLRRGHIKFADLNSPKYDQRLFGLACTKKGLDYFNRGLTSLHQLQNIPARCLRYYLTDTVLVHGFITPDQLKRTPTIYLKQIFSGNRVRFIEQGLVNFEEVVRLDSDRIPFLLSKPCLVERLVPQTAVRSLPVPFLEELWAGSGLLALRDGSLSLDDLSQMPSLSHLHCYILNLGEKIFEPYALLRLRKEHVQQIFSPSGLQALKLGLLSADQALHYNSNLRFILRREILSEKLLPWEMVERTPALNVEAMLLHAVPLLRKKEVREREEGKDVKEVEKVANKERKGGKMKE
jgi:hypothetical protein